MLSAVKRIDGMGFTIHVWGWENSMTRAYEGYAGVETHLLDAFMDSFGYRETAWIPAWGGVIDPWSAVVLGAGAMDLILRNGHKIDMNKLVRAVETKTLLFRHNITVQHGHIESK